MLDEKLYRVYGRVYGRRGEAITARVRCQKYRGSSLKEPGVEQEDLDIKHVRHSYIAKVRTPRHAVVFSF